MLQGLFRSLFPCLFIYQLYSTLVKAIYILYTLTLPEIMEGKQLDIHAYTDCKIVRACIWMRDPRLIIRDKSYQSKTAEIKKHIQSNMAATTDWVSYLCEALQEDEFYPGRAEGLSWLGRSRR